MANNIQWTPQSFSPVKFDPTQGFAAASKSFGNISDTLDARKAEESLAAVNAEKMALLQQQQAFTEAAPARAIAEEERLLAKSAKQGILANKLAQEAGGSRVDSLFGDTATLAESPEFRELSGLQVGGVGPMEPAKAKAVFAAQDKFVENNKAAVSDPKKYRTQLLTGLLESGEFKREEAETIADTETTRLFPTMSDEMIKASLGVLKGAPGSAGSSGAGGTGTFKPWSAMPTVMQENDIHKNFMELYPVDKGENFSLLGVEFDYTSIGGAHDVTGPDIRKLSTNMKQQGINPAATYAVVEKYIQGNNLDFDPTNMTPAQESQFKSDAQQIMAQQASGYNSKTGASSGAASNAQAQQNYFDAADSILSRGTTKNMSDDELVSSFLGSISGTQPAGIMPPAQTAPAAVSVESNAVVEEANAEPVNTQQAAQSVPAIIGSFVKTGLEVNAEGIKTLKWLSDQTGQGVIELVKSFKNAPEWLAEFQKGYQQ